MYKIVDYNSAIASSILSSGQCGLTNTQLSLAELLPNLYEETVYSSISLWINLQG